MRNKKTFILLLPILLLSSSAFAQTVEDIIARAIAAEGGEAKSRIKTMVVKGKLSVPAHGIEGDFLGYFKRPNKDQMKIIVGGSEMIQATNGSICWIIDQIRGSGEPTQMPNDVCETYKRNADFDAPYYNMNAKGITAELVGKEQLEDVVVNHVILTFRDGHKRDFYFRAENNLLYMAKEKHLTQSGTEMVTTVIVDDYRDVEGAKYAFYNKHTTGNVDMILQWEEVEINLELDDSLFEMPLKQNR